MTYFRTNSAAHDFKKKLEEARHILCPNRISGGACRRYGHLSKKPQETWTEDDKIFMEYAQYIRDARQRYYQEQEAERRASKPKDFRRVAAEGDKMLPQETAVSQQTTDELRFENALIAGNEPTVMETATLPALNSEN